MSGLHSPTSQRQFMPPQSARQSPGAELSSPTYRGEASQPYRAQHQQTNEYRDSNQESYQNSNNLISEELANHRPLPNVPRPARSLSPELDPQAESARAPQAGPSEIKKANPLIDLIETEQTYVDDLASIIKRVAAAWSRTNFPPPALDQMFRAIEAVYRINRVLLGKLEEIGPNPSSPKALGDLLMRWVSSMVAMLNLNFEIA